MTAQRRSEQLRLLLDTCARLARDRHAGEPVTAELDEALAALRDEFADHNQVESAVIADLLQGSAAWASLLIDRMLESMDQLQTFAAALRPTPSARRRRCTAGPTATCPTTSATGYAPAWRPASSTAWAGSTPGPRRGPGRARGAA
jgi:iron-sulfur cluster repair protein YtfE (RIC family)